MILTSALALGLAALPAPGARAASGASMGPSVESHVTPEMDRLILSGIDEIYRMRFDKAEEVFRRVEELSPGHPFAAFGRCSVAWTHYVYGTDEDDPELLRRFEEVVRLAAESSKAWTRAHPRDADALMAMGAVHGILGRLLATRGQYLRAYWNARTAMKSVQAALALDPGLDDARLGLGMYDYYTDLYPRMVRALTKLVLRGDRLRGIQNLRLVARKGRYMSVTAKMILVEIYTSDPFGAKDPEAAVKIMEEVRRLYPESPMVHSAELVALHEAGRTAEFLAGARRYLAASESGLYPPSERAKGLALVAAGLWRSGRREEALESFRAAGEAAPGPRARRWPLWALVRAGQTADALGRREEAVALYRRAAAQRDPWGLHRLAAQYAGRPFSPAAGAPPLLPP